MGYVPAQARAWEETDDAVRLMWLENAVSQGHPGAMFTLADELELRYLDRDEARALALFKQATELGDMDAQYVHGEKAFGKYDWRRYYWWGLGCRDWA